MTNALAADPDKRTTFARALVISALGGDGGNGERTKMLLLREEGDSVEDDWGRVDDWPHVFSHSLGALAWTPRPRFANEVALLRVRWAGEAPRSAIQIRSCLDCGTDNVMPRALVAADVACDLAWIARNAANQSARTSPTADDAGVLRVFLTTEDQGREIQIRSDSAGSQIRIR